MHRKIAILIRDITQFGGGEKDVVTLIEGLNQKGMIPYLFSERDASKERINTFFNKNISYHYKPFPRSQSNILRVIHELFFPHPLKATLKEYNFIYDFTNKPPVYFDHPHYIKYLYIIEDSRVLTTSFSRSMQFKLYTFLAKAGIKKFKKVSPHITNITQSKFVQQEIKKKTGINVPIIYPPVDISTFNSSTHKKRQVVSVGRISPEKNQEDILAIAQEMPKLPFLIIGKVDNKTYYQKLKKIVREAHIENATILPNLSRKELVRNLEESEYFLSMTKEEHFGIAIVEAIAAGCIPFSHNSGGPVEIIGDQRLLFNSNDDALIKINTFTKITHEEKTSTQNKMLNNIKAFGEENFTTKMLTYL